MSWKGMSGPRGPSSNPNGPFGEHWIYWGESKKMTFFKYLPVGRDVIPAVWYKLVVAEDYDLGRTVNLLFFLDEQGEEMNERETFRFNSGTILVMQESAL